jgi:hypothetical protein
MEKALEGMSKIIAAPARCQLRAWRKRSLLARLSPIV